MIIFCLETRPTSEEPVKVRGKYGMISEADGKDRSNVAVYLAV